MPRLTARTRWTNTSTTVSTSTTSRDSALRVRSWATTTSATEIADCFDYGIVQAYYSSGYTDLQSRFNNAYNKGWKPEQYIFAEDFEKGWQNGGVNHRMRNGQTVPSLFGMAYFNPDQGTGGGFGAYHMEYEYGHNDMVYKFMRQAIQLVNPAPAGDYSKTLVSINGAADGTAS